ncbi:MAG: sigma-70 family RNA polymerase sigma factor [Armatimonadota bacterium]
MSASQSLMIWHEFHKRVRAFIARRVENEADVEDILQSVFLRIHRGAGTLKHADRLVSWLFQVTRNAIADHYREPAQQREVSTDFTSETEAEMKAVQPGTEMDVAAPDMDEATIIEELSACLRPMTQHLPPHYRDAITLVELESVTHREAAIRHGISISGMKSTVQRGRQMLRRMLEDCCHIHVGPAGTIDDYTARGPSCVRCSSVNKNGRVS